MLTFFVYRELNGADLDGRSLVVEHAKSGARYILTRVVGDGDGDGEGVV